MKRTPPPPPAAQESSLDQPQWTVGLPCLKGWRSLSLSQVPLRVSLAGCTGGIAGLHWKDPRDWPLIPLGAPRAPHDRGCTSPGPWQLACECFWWPFGDTQPPPFPSALTRSRKGRPLARARRWEGWLKGIHFTHGCRVRPDAQGAASRAWCQEVCPASLVAPEETAAAEQVWCSEDSRDLALATAAAESETPL